MLRITRPNTGPEKRSRQAESEGPFWPIDGRARDFAFQGGGWYTCAVATEMILSQKLKLFPTRAKADTLALLAGLFRRLHAVATQSLAAMEQPRLPSCKGKGEFVGRAYRRAFTD